MPTPSQDNADLDALLTVVAHLARRPTGREAAPTMPTPPQHDAHLDALLTVVDLAGGPGRRRAGP
jgi:hypothetical protein